MQNRLPSHPRDKFATVLTALLLIVGLYAPSSLGEVISVRLYLLDGLALLTLLTFLLLRSRGVLSVYAVLNAAAINVILLVATLFCSFTEFAYGGYIPILFVTVLLCVSVRGMRLTPVVRGLFDFCNAVNIALAAGLLLEVPVVTQFFLTHYAYGYDELLPYMVAEGKPVLMFGTHSVAGFFFYLLFYLTFQTFAACRSKLNLIYALCYVCLLGSLYSFTSVVFTSVAVVQIIMHFQWHKSFVAGTVATALTLIVLATLLPRVDIFDRMTGDLTEITQREDNGLIGRYSSSSGGLLANLEYIAEHPLRPIGLGLSRRLWYADSGPVEYLLKGSFPLLFSVYGGAFFFFYSNLQNKRRAVFLFLVFLSFELGYSNLQYIRTQFFLPFLLIYVNGIDARKAPTRWRPTPGNCDRWVCA